MPENKHERAAMANRIQRGFGEAAARKLGLMVPTYCSPTCSDVEPTREQIPISISEHTVFGRVAWEWLLVRTFTLWSLA